jgi:phosphate transport system substrate-binding protein
MKAWWGILALAFAMGLPSCGGIKGAGASRPARLYQDWAEQIRNSYPSLAVSYDSSSSGEGVELLFKRKVDFAGSDVRPTVRSTETGFSAREDIIEVPSAIGAIAPIYNTRGVSQTLHFSPKLLSDIFSGKVTDWHARAVRDENPSVNLPRGEIKVIRRSDNSGTSCVFAEFLSKVDPTSWQPIREHHPHPWDIGCRFSWAPGSTGVDTSDALLDKVQHTPGSIGYIEYIYPAEAGQDNPVDVDWGYVMNEAGTYQRARLANIRAATAGLTSLPSSSLLKIDAKNLDAYPISAFTWLVIRIPPRNRARKQLCDFLDWMLHDGQIASEGHGFVALPKPLADQALGEIRSQKICP